MQTTDIDRRDTNGNPAWLDKPAAASLARVDAAWGRQVPVTWAGRTWDEQDELWDKYGHNPAKAARPGTSPHERGDAIDTDEHTEPGFVALMAEHGWTRPLKSEPWHFVYSESRDRHINDPAPTGATTKEHHMIVFIRGKAGVRNGGVYVEKGGKLHFIGAANPGGIPVFTSETQISRLVKLYPFA